MENNNNYFRIIPDIDGLDFSYIERLKSTRGWFTPHFYKCLPLSIANQMGYAMLSPFNFSVIWNGGNNISDLQIVFDDIITQEEHQKLPFIIGSSFGHGILSFYPKFMVRTPENINTLVKQPPNLRKQGVAWMEGMIETDNLMSTFSVNLKMTDANRKIRFVKGEPIACFIPYPRFFMDTFKLEISNDEKEVELYRKKQEAFKEQRNKLQNHEIEKNGQYRKGTDFEGCPFHNQHQVKVDNLDKKRD